MTLEKQNEFLLSLLNLFLTDLGAHLGFLDWVKTVAKGQDIEGILEQCQRDPAVKPEVTAYLQWLAVLLAESSPLEPNQAYREFLRRWTELGTAN